MSAQSEELRLGDEPDAVPWARAFVAAAVPRISPFATDLVPDAVRLATVVLGEFRAAAVEREDITSLARQMDSRMRPYLGDEDFVTALIAEVDSTGLASVACCGHRPALLCIRGEHGYLGGCSSASTGRRSARTLQDRAGPRR